MLIFGGCGDVSGCIICHRLGWLHGMVAELVVTISAIVWERFCPLIQLPTVP